MGDNAHGIVAYHFGTADLREIDITVENVTASGANADGVRIGVSKRRRADACRDAGGLPPISGPALKLEFGAG